MANFDFSTSNAFSSPQDVVDGMLMREEDFGRKNELLYLGLFKEVYQRLNLAFIRQTVRYIIPVNKSIKAINVPDNYLDFSSIGINNHHGKFEPLVLNFNQDTDYVDQGMLDTCGCDCGCDCPLCSTVKHYETILSDIPALMPDNSTKIFQGYTKKILQLDGSYVRETATPTAIYENNTHTDTALKTTKELLCKLEIKECGCVKQTHKNEELLMGCCDSISLHYDVGCPVRYLKQPPFTYKMSDDRSRIEFPPNFPYDHVMLRYFAHQNTKDIKVPYMAVRAIRSGIKLEQYEWQQPGSKLVAAWEKTHSKDVGILAENMTKLKLSNFYAGVLGEFDVL